MQSNIRYMDAFGRWVKSEPEEGFQLRRFSSSWSEDNDGWHGETSYSGWETITNEGSLSAPVEMPFDGLCALYDMPDWATVIPQCLEGLDVSSWDEWVDDNVFDSRLSAIWDIPEIRQTVKWGREERQREFYIRVHFEKLGKLGKRQRRTPLSAVVIEFWESISGVDTKGFVPLKGVHVLYVHHLETPVVPVVEAVVPVVEAVEAVVPVVEAESFVYVEFDTPVCVMAKVYGKFSSQELKEFERGGTLKNARWTEDGVRPADGWQALAPTNQPVAAVAGESFKVARGTRRTGDFYGVNLPLDTKESTSGTDLASLVAKFNKKI